jgi:hypothetical protein
MKAYLQRFLCVLIVALVMTVCFWIAGILFSKTINLIRTIELPSLNPLTYYTIIVLALSAIIALFRK